MAITISGDTPNFSAATTTTATVTTLNAPTGVLATQNGMTGIAKAWVFWNANSGTPIINSSFNVSSITYSSTGLFNINFTTAFASANYAMAGSVGVLPGASGGFLGIRDNTFTNTTSACGVYSVNGSNALTNYTINNAVFFSS